MKEELKELTEEVKGHVDKGIDKAKTDIKTETDAAVKAVKDELEAEKAESKKVKDEVVKLTEEIAGMKEVGKREAKESLRDLIVKSKDNLIKLKNKEIKNFEITIKASQVPSDVGNRTDYAEFLPGTERKPVRRPFLRELFKTITVGTEYIKYREEDVVTRDAKVVVACATSTHNTKKSWINRTVQISKVRDFVDVCIDMIEDYDFVESEIRELVDESVALKTDQEMFNGTGDILSIDSISSEFDAANALAPYTGATGFQSPTLADLTAAMAAQIFTFGAENKWQADTILMNHNDWVRFMHEKDTQNAYLLPNFIASGGRMLNEMRVVTNPLVAPDTLYVFDSTKGQILDRKMRTIEFAYENKDNFEHETVTIKAVERLQFHVKLINRDAFMKASSISAALTAITKS